LRILLAFLMLLLLITGCVVTQEPTPGDGETLQAMDAAGRQVDLPVNPQRVVALSSSLAGIWLEAGGTLVGVSNDAIDEQALQLGDDVVIVGTIKEPSADIILALQPDLVLLSPDITGHTQIAPTLDQAGIQYFFAAAETFQDYLQVLETFTTLTGKPENLTRYGTSQQEKIDQYLSGCSLKRENPTVLVMRAFSSGVKAKADGIIPTEILDDYGVTNIARQNSSLLEDLSLEKILEENPDYIFIVFMGDDTDNIMNNLEASLTGNPSWSTLDAVKNQQFYILPKELFHFKPNGRWHEAYAYLYEILCQP